MWKYIVFWTLSYSIQTECPDANRVDEFGRSVNNGYSCLVYHAEIVEEKHQKEFDNKTLGLEFIERAKEINEYKGSWNASSITNIKLDSIRK